MILFLCWTDGEDRIRIRELVIVVKLNPSKRFSSNDIATFSTLSNLMFYVYLLKSEEHDRFYIGYSENPERRLIDHNSGKVKSTRNYRPWRKIYTEAFIDEISAIRREKEIKSKKSRRYLEWLIDTSR